MIKKAGKFFSLAIAISLMLSGCGKSSLAEVNYSIKCYNVGKGDAFLIYSDDSAVMIDTGYKENADDLLSDMEDLGVESLDCLIISHFDKDHVGGAAKIIDKMDIKRVISTYQTNEDKRTVKFFEALEEKGIDDEIISENKSFTIDDAEYDVYPAQSREYSDKEDNNSSLLVRMSYEDFSMLFTGDAETERLSEYSSYGDISSTILKVPYHGHFQSILSELVKQCSPEYAIITSSNDVPEDIDTMKILEQSDIKTYITRNGDILIQTDGSNVKISQ